MLAELAQMPRQLLVRFKAVHLTGSRWQETCHCNQRPSHEGEQARS